jgi:hypothetical protein
LFELRFSSQVSAPMPRFLIDYHCNGHTAQDCEGVEFGSVEQAGAHALAAAPQMFNDLLPGERRECALSVRDESQGWRLKIDLSLCLGEAGSSFGCYRRAGRAHRILELAPMAACPTAWRCSAATVLPN